MSSSTLLCALLVAGSSACGSATPQGGAVLARAADQQATSRQIHIAATKHGFEPDRIDVQRGDTVTLVFTRTAERTCAKDVVLYLSEANKLKRDLPLNQPVAITLTFTRIGELGFACGMSMLGGAIHVR